MFSPGIEQKSRAGLDDAAKLQISQQAGDALALTVAISAERIERIMIKRDRDAIVAKLRQDEQRVIEPMMRETVGVVAKKHGGAEVEKDQGTASM